MLARNEQEKSGIPFPEEWTQKFKKLLTSIYFSQLEKKCLEIEVFAFAYPNEVLLIVTMADKANKGVPVSYFASCDLDEKAGPVKQLETMADSVGLFLDQYFAAEEDWEDFIDLWTEAEVKKMKFYYKVVRENVSLSLMADKILSGMQD